MKLRIGPNQIINIPVYFTPKITSETKIKTLEIYVYGFRNQQGKPVKSKIRLEGTVSQSSQCVANHITKYKMGLTNDSQSQNSTLDTAFCIDEYQEEYQEEFTMCGKSHWQKQNGPCK